MQQDQPIWTPTPLSKQQSMLTAFQTFLEESKQLYFNDYTAMHEWSVRDLSGFWDSIARFFEVEFSKPPHSIVKIQQPFYKTLWFEGAELSYTHHIERHFKHGQPALFYGNEKGEIVTITWNALLKRAVEIQAKLKQVGVGMGDVVVGYLHYHPDSIAAFLATNALGAIWSCCSPDFGTASVISRLGQLHPKVLLTVKEYTYNGKRFDLAKKVAFLSANLKSLERTISFPGDLTEWDFTTQEVYQLKPLSVPFDHPIWVLFSSGTTGKPKAITHRTGGMLLEQLKAMALHQNVQSGERFFWHTTTGWMMWNYALGALLCGAQLCIFDGSVAYPDMGVQWRFANQVKIDHFGHGAPFFTQAMKADLREVNQEKLPQLKTIGATGAPLSADAFRWLQNRLPQAHIISLSGGTDVCSAFIGGNPWHPVYAGYLQSPMLGADIAAWDTDGCPVTMQTAELILAQPMPCMPLYFWDDKENKRYHESYFGAYKGVWTHGDWIAIDPQKGIQILGRSDATLNKNGIRIGTAELYQALDTLHFLQDHLIVDVGIKEGLSELLLFVVIASSLTPKLEEDIRSCIRQQCSPRHVPDRIFQVSQVPYTLSGKKLEIPVKKILTGAAAKNTANPGAMRNPDSLLIYEDIYKKLKSNT